MRKEEGQEMASTLDVKFLETSARDSINVEETFVTMAEEILKSLEK